MSSTATGSSSDNNPYQFITLSQSPRQRTSRNYVLKLRQQPKHSRMCGFGEKVDRRPLDPPPIIQLEIQNTTSADENSYLYNPYYFMYASLISPDSEEELHLLRDGKTRSTTGSIVSSLYRLKDLDNKDGAFFVFPDLSVRMEGAYRLKFSLFEIINTEIYYCTSICSDVFNVYPAKKFPGMEESTFLSRTFAEQGLKIRIRKELRMRKGRGKKGNNDAEDSPDPKKRGRKKSRRASMDGSDNGSESGYSDDGRSEPAQRRRIDRNSKDSSAKDGNDKLAHGQQPFPGYDRRMDGYDPSRPMNPMGHPDPRHYGHLPHDSSGHVYPHYGPMPGMQPKVWPGHGDPYQSSVPPHYAPIPHYESGAPYPPPPSGGPSGPEEYPVPYDVNQRPGYPPHHYAPRDHERSMGDWHHREYPRHPAYGPGPYMTAHGYDDPQARPPTQVSNEHAGAPPPPSGPYYGHHPAAPKPGDYKPDVHAHVAKYPPNYAFNSNFHVPPPHPSTDATGAVRPPQHAEYPHHMHSSDKQYSAPHPSAHVGHAPYYAGAPYPPTSGGSAAQQPPAAGMSYAYQTAPTGPPATGNENAMGVQQAGPRDARSAGTPQKAPGQDESAGFGGYPPQYAAYGQYKLPPIHEITDKNRPQQPGQGQAPNQQTAQSQQAQQQQQQIPVQAAQQAQAMAHQQTSPTAGRGTEGGWM
ncbi:hypothetical protein SpCBS45565_g07062 [Spizellomyces sp. 'palustris']|nr:hypothetical protein SpCBS45565_g07062 [Spizellomyces sp. 'palustris']